MIVLFDEDNSAMIVQSFEKGGDNMKRVYMDIPDELHDQWKQQASKQGKSMKGFLEFVIKEIFEKGEKQNVKKVKR